MTKEKKSYDLVVHMSEVLDKDHMMGVIERAATATGLYISHSGSYSRKKYPNSVHWHFKRDRKESGLIDATYWKEGAKFWLSVRNNEPEWVHQTAPELREAIQAEFA